METDLELAYRTLNAIAQGQPVSQEEIDLALACVNRAIHQVRALRRNWEDMSRHLQRPEVRSELVPASEPAPLAVVEQQLFRPVEQSRSVTG